MFLLLLFLKGGDFSSSAKVLPGASTRSSQKNFSETALKLPLTKAFVLYHTTFKTYSRLRDDTITCDRNENTNETALAFEASITQCASARYVPKLLSSKQVSWKQIEKGDSDDSSVSTSGAKRTKNSAKKEVNSSFVVHNYFALTLLLPNHPFSADLYQEIKIVGSMFPTVSFAVGNGYEFSELCVQYGIQTFPKLLFFKNGLLHAVYRGEHAADEIAAQISIWTASLPKAVPVSIELRELPSTQSKLRNTLEIVSEYPKLDPIFWISPSVFDIDYYLYVVSAIYAFFRVIMCCESQWRRPVSEL